MSASAPGWLRRTWRALTRPRSLGPRRRMHARRGQRGVAMLVVVTTLMVMVVIVSELAYSSRVRFLVAAHQSDRVKAYWLARSGVNLYRMLLMGSKQMKGQLSGMLPAEFQDMIPDNLWQMLPVVNTGLLRMMLGGGLDDSSDVDATDLMSLQDEIDEQGIEEESREGSIFADRNFLDFEGDFSVEVFDHDSRVNVNAFAQDASVNAIESTTGQQLFALMSGQENDQWFYERGIDRWEVIGNLKDWADPDGFRSGGLGGQEDSLYQTKSPPYLSKNAAFDTMAEIRVVEGWQGEVYDKFGEYITVFGDPAGKLNAQTAAPEVIETLARGCPSGSPPQDAQLVQCRQNIATNMVFGFMPDSGQEFADAYRTYCGIELDEQCLNQRIGNESNTFTVTSTGLVGTSSVTITAVLDFRTSGTGKLVYWRVD